MNELTIAEIVDTMNRKFESGNSIPVERTQITKDEWELLVSYIGGLEIAVDELIESDQETEN